MAVTSPLECGHKLRSVRGLVFTPVVALRLGVDALCYKSGAFCNHVRVVFFVLFQSLRYYVTTIL